VISASGHLVIWLSGDWNHHHRWPDDKTTKWLNARTASAVLAVVVSGLKAVAWRLKTW